MKNKIKNATDAYFMVCFVLIMVFYQPFAHASASSTIPSVVAGIRHTVGLKSDGLVVAVGSNFLGKLKVNCWRDITQANAGVYNTLGLKSDGRVVAVGYNDNGQTNIFDWVMISPDAMTKTTLLPLKD